MFTSMNLLVNIIVFIYQQIIVLLIISLHDNAVKGKCVDFSCFFIVRHLNIFPGAQNFALTHKQQMMKMMMMMIKINQNTDCQYSHL